MLDCVQFWLDFAFVGNYFIQVLVPQRTINRIIFQVSAFWDLTRFFNLHHVPKLAFSDNKWLILLHHSREMICNSSKRTFKTLLKTFGYLGNDLFKFSAIFKQMCHCSGSKKKIARIFLSYDIDLQ